MKSIAVGALALFAATAPALAALPPHFQRQAEFQAVLRLAVERFGISRPLEAIVLVEKDVFEARAGNCTLLVRIVDLPQGDRPLAGPRQFSAEAGEPSCD